MVGILDAGETSLTPSSATVMGAYLLKTGGIIAGALEVQGGSTFGVVTLTASFSDDVVLSLVGTEGALNIASGANGSFTVVSDVTSVDFSTSSSYFYFQDALRVASEIRIFGSSTYLNSTQGFIAGNEIITDNDYTAADVLTKLLTVDGAGSGVDTDLFQGLAPTQFGRLGSASNWSATQTYNDNVKAQFGNNGEMQLYHDGTNSILNITAGLFVMQFNVASRFTFSMSSGSLTATGNITANGDIFAAGGNKVYHPGNDGAGSGVDTDLVHGMTPSQGVLTMDDFRNGNLFNAGQYIGLNAYLNGGVWKARKSTDGAYAFRNGGSGVGLELIVEDGAVTSGNILPAYATYAFRDGDIHITGGYNVDGIQVLGAQGAAVADATDAASAITQLNALLARARSHGWIAA
ncbi:MAG: hypothetical protein COB56_01045 [Robiginitomaculum sp.]|nr:MAG: hypothetical protein COB56_01045 [Robiginitomaculum sp.]